MKQKHKNIYFFVFFFYLSLAFLANINSFVSFKFSIVFRWIILFHFKKMF